MLIEHCCRTLWGYMKVSRPIRIHYAQRADATMQYLLVINASRIKGHVDKCNVENRRGLIQRSNAVLNSCVGMVYKLNLS